MRGIVNLFTCFVLQALLGSLICYVIPQNRQLPCHMQNIIVLNQELFLKIHQCNSECLKQSYCLSAVFCEHLKQCFHITDFSQLLSMPPKCHFHLKVCEEDRHFFRRKRGTGYEEDYYNHTLQTDGKEKTGDYIDFGVMVAVLLIIIFTITCLAKAESSGIREMR